MHDSVLDGLQYFEFRFESGDIFIFQISERPVGVVDSRESDFSDANDLFREEGSISPIFELCSLRYPVYQDRGKSQVSD
jgi:hypothetical protein